jgi:hypothetical protein
MNAFAVDQAASLRWSLGDLARLRHAGVRTSGDVPTWVQPFVARLNDLIASVGADPRGHEPMNVHDLMNAFDFIARVMRPDTVQPWVGLLASGGLQINWRQNDVEVEAVFDTAGGDHVVFVSVGDEEWDAPSDAAYSLFNTVVDRLSTSQVERRGAPA